MNRSLVAMVLFTALCPPRAAVARLKVAATVPDLAAIARAVGGARAEVYSLTLPSQNPHFVDARPHLALKLNRADLLLVVGLQLEVGWLPTLLTGARNPRIRKGGAGYLDCSTVVRLREVPKVRVDRSMGDVHPGGNPHYLVDPDNATRVARAVARRMGQQDPAGKKGYLANAARFEVALQQARRRWSAALKPYRGTAVVPYHRSWIYFTRATGLRVVAHLEPKPGIPPSAAHVLRVIRAMRAQQVPLMIQEEYFPDRTARLIAGKTGARLLVLPGGARLRRGESYIQRMDATIKKLLVALKRAPGVAP